MTDWNPEKYLDYNTERLLPSRDLVSRIRKANPGVIADIGCGPGNSTRVLAERWPSAEIIGVDNSPAMIEKASRDFSGISWVIADGAGYHPEKGADILFSNAAIQWMPDHTALMKHFHRILNPEGILAVQIPLFHKMPLSRAIEKAADYPKWKKRFENLEVSLELHDYGYYYDLLASVFSSVEIWTTEYMHILNSHKDILNMMHSTGLRPYLNHLGDESLAEEFENDVLSEIKNSYPPQKDGKVILPFMRLFFTAYKD